ncbi:hypothetical protein Bca52824_096972 [Brassica carinata]|uniref:Uncharacterized protein n=1 Tax=Brassica carinata TaxID=52824 RepID=A0A8X7NWQ8_BRACI|nr:hypothetical protein Bca52824_096972 [Brassica carinata]
MAGRRDRTQQLRGSRIAIAILIGIIIGCVCAVLFPNGFFTSSSSLTANERVQVGSSSCESPARIKMLKSDFASLSEKNAELKKQLRDLTEKLRLAEQGSDNARKQVLSLGSQIKAGPFGTVKSLRTNPTILPDESVNPRLAKILEDIAVDKEVIVALANSNVKAMLEVQIASVKRLGIKTTSSLRWTITSRTSVNQTMLLITRDPDKDVDTVGKTGGNHAVSGLKFRVLRVLAARIRPTVPSIELLDRVADRLSKAKLWDQAVLMRSCFILRILTTLGCMPPRVMDMYEFMNNKLYRMQAVVEFYVNGKQGGDSFPDGSE